MRVNNMRISVREHLRQMTQAGEGYDGVGEPKWSGNWSEVLSSVALILVTTPSTCCRVSSALAGSESDLSTLPSRLRSQTKRHKSVVHERSQCQDDRACSCASVSTQLGRRCASESGGREGEQARSGIITSN